MPAPPAAPPPQTFPYDYLFKVLIIGDASVGKVSFPYSFFLRRNTTSMADDGFGFLTEIPLSQLTPIIVLILYCPPQLQIQST